MNLFALPLVFFLAGAVAGAMAIWSMRREGEDAEILRIQLEDAINAIDDGFVLFDHEDRIVTSNAPFRDQFGPVGDTISPGDTYSAVVHRIAASGMIPGIEGQEEAFVKRLVTQRLSEFGLEKTFQTHNGRWIRQRDKKTAAGNVVGTRTDVTELKEALARAEAGDQAKSAFLATMSHEIRTPMNGILGMAEILAADNLPPNQAELVDTIASSGAALMQILNDILDFSKLEAGKLALEDRAFDLVACLTHCQRLLSPKATQDGIALTLSTAPDLPPWVMGDETRVRQVVLNLLNNALKFTEAGSVTVDAAPGAKTNEILITVTDSGIGIPEDVRDRIFERFSQADDSTTRRFGGTGLGLPISRELARAMAGDLTVASVPETGSTFCFTACLPAVDPPRREEKAKRPSLASLVGLRLLVAEDNRTNRLVLEKMLAGSGAKIDFAFDGAQAVQAFRDAPPDAVLMDLSMPVMNGLDATRAIRCYEAEARLIARPIIALTANAFSDDRDKCQEAGMTGFLSKPVRRERLITALTEAKCTSDAGFVA